MKNKKFGKLKQKLDKLEEKYNLLIAIQPKIEIENFKQNINNILFKGELLIRSHLKKYKHDGTTRSLFPDEIINRMQEKNDNNKLFYYMLYKSLTLINNNKNTSFSVNSEISDIMGNNFYENIDLFEKEYGAENLSKITVEILESENLPKFKEEEKEFFEKLRFLQKKGIKISLDDFGGGNSTLDRITKFIDEGIFGNEKGEVKIDRLFAIACYEYYEKGIKTEKNINLIKKAYGLKNDNIFDNFYYFNYLKEKGIKIVVEGIEDFKIPTNCGLKETISQKEFIRFCKTHFKADLGQGYGLGKPEKPEYYNLRV